VNKLCTKCKEEKSVDCFSKRNASKDGLRYACKACMKEYLAKYYLEHSEELVAAHTKYWQTAAGRG